MKGARILIVAAWFAVASGGVAEAQSLNFGSGDTPIEVVADNGIEWQQERLVFVARGNARASRDGVDILADELHAYYRKSASNETEIWRLDAVGSVRIKSSEGTAYGDRAVYDVDNAILTITGKNLKLEAGEDWLTARDQLEYWEAKKMAVARGGAVAKRQNRKLQADILAAYFRESKTGETTVYRIDAFDNVKINTATEQVTSERGVYDVEKGFATLTGSVKINRDGNVLAGCKADVNLKTGVSRMHSCASTGTRVKGIIRPKTKDRK